MPARYIVYTCSCAAAVNSRPNVSFYWNHLPPYPISGIFLSDPPNSRLSRRTFFYVRWTCLGSVQTTLKLSQKLFERSEFLIDTSQKKSLRVCTRARVHACTRVRLLLVLVCGIMYRIRTYLISARLPRYVYVAVSYTHLTLPTNREV